MPEGDSVWRAARRLDRVLAGQVLARSDFRVPQLATVNLAGRAVLGTDTHGKHLFTRFDDEKTLHTHFRMDGSWTVVGVGKRLPRRMRADVRVALEAEPGHCAYGLLLPVVELINTRDERQVTDHLGPDPLRVDWDPAEATARLAADPGRPLAAALIDQRNLAGPGNLWVNEICFLRGASPWAPVGSVDLPPVVALAARALRQSIRMRGNGQVTTGDRRAGEEHWVYGRTRLPCRRCGTRIRYRPEVPGDPARRATWWCPSCQPGPDPEASGG